MRLGLGLSLKRRAVALLEGWLLSGGLWNDGGTWDDTAEWED